jgi:hypothetical protein
MGAAVQGAQPPTPISCEECQTRLAGWIDGELETGLATAAREDPAVWWHLWTCADCAEIYGLTRALAAATMSNELPPPPLMPIPALQPRRLLRSFQLSRAFLAYALPVPSASLGILRGVDSGSVLVEDEDEGRRINLSVREQPDLNWRVSVTVAPPVAGWLLLTLGEQSFRARFDEKGLAVVVDVPAALLSEASGPDLRVAVELDEDDPAT